MKDNGILPNCVEYARAQEEIERRWKEKHTKEEKMSDLIERQAAIDALKEHRALYCDNTPNTFSKLSYAEKSRVDELDTAIATLVNLPPAQPDRKKGKWRHYEGYLTCSECGTEYDDDIMTHCGDDVPKFCPSCGADMRGERRENDTEMD